MLKFKKMSGKNKKQRTYPKRKTCILSVLAVFILVAALSGCGGGGGGGGSSAGGPTVPDAPEIRSALRLTNQTNYLPSETEWILYDATAADFWVSAIGNSPGLSASMTNPYSEAGVWFMPTDGYYNPGKVDFYIDGSLVGSLDLSQTTPYEGYRDDHITYYQVAKDLAETTHTITMVIATGTVAFDGWHMVYKGLMYDIDCSDSNTLEKDTVTEVNKIRNAIEGFAQDYGAYPDPGAIAVHEYLDSATYSYFTTDVMNAFTDDPIAATSTYSAGDYNYTYKSASDYELTAYGGTSTFYTVTPDSVTSPSLTLSLTSPQNHLTTTAGTVTFAGTSSVGGNLTITGAQGGYSQLPATGNFSADITLSEGLDHYTVELTDQYGNSIDMIRSITKDTTAPDIGIIDPFPVIAQGDTKIATVDTTPYTLKGYSEALATVTVNGASVSLDSLGVFTYSMNLQLGDNTVTIVSTDAFSNQNTYTFTIVYSP